MKFIQHSVYSQILGQDFEFRVYGHSGKPLMVFPCSNARQDCWETHGMMEILAPLVRHGELMVVAVDGRDWESWFKPVRDEWIAKRNTHYESCIVTDVTKALFDSYGIQEKMTAAGTSMGAFHAANFFLKHPNIFDSAICLSGIYSFAPELGGFYEPGLYYHEPLAYLPNLEDQKYLARLHQGYIVVAHGRGQWETRNGQSAALCDILTKKQIPHLYDVWGEEYPHDWKTWKEMLVKHISMFKTGVDIAGTRTRLIGPGRRLFRQGKNR